jgi:serine/threonine protein kinase
MTTRRDEIVDLIVRWEEARARGEELSLEELCRDCPQFLGELRRSIEQLGRVEWLNEPLSPLSSTGAHEQAPSHADHTLPRIMAGRYRVDALIGEGGFGRVYRGFDTWLERFVALKVPRMDRAVSSSEVDLCRTEARKVALLRHPNIIPVHDVGRDDGTCFIVSDWIDGVNLESHIREGRLSLAESTAILAQVADALQHAHGLGLVHRDIKPANILIDRKGQAYLTDFGIAAVEEDLLREVGNVGTLPYMAPEQLDPAIGPVDHRTDLYALGVVLYECLTGRRPFLARSPVVLRAQILGDTPPAPTTLDATVPSALAGITVRCMARQPDDRFQHADDVSAALRGFLAG